MTKMSILLISECFVNDYAYEIPNQTTGILRDSLARNEAGNFGNAFPLKRR